MRTDDGPDLSDRIPEARAPGAHVVLVGVGNIGSHLVSHLGRITEVGRVTIIDRDRYERANLVGQEILPGDIGRAKSRAQAMSAVASVRTPGVFDTGIFLFVASGTTMLS